MKLYRGHMKACLSLELSFLAKGNSTISTTISERQLGTVSIGNELILGLVVDKQLLRLWIWSSTKACLNA
jgi:hypothetical protein